MRAYSTFTICCCCTEHGCTGQAHTDTRMHGRTHNICEQPTRFCMITSTHAFHVRYGVGLCALCRYPDPKDPSNKQVSELRPDIFLSDKVCTCTCTCTCILILFVLAYAYTHVFAEVFQIPNLNLTTSCLSLYPPAYTRA